MAVRAVTFKNHLYREFGREVKERVNAYFEENNLSKHANGAMVLKTIVLLGGYFGVYALIVWGGFSHWVNLALCVVFGIFTAGIGFSVAHDALHGAYSDKAWVNRILGYTFDVMGANGYIWKITHNIIHHTYTNIHGHDEDLEVASFIRLSPGIPHQPIHRVQHILAFIAYAFATFFWVFVKDFRYFFKPTLGPYENKHHPISEWITLICFKSMYFIMMIGIPFMFMDITWVQWAIGFIALHITTGLILGIIFQLAHVVEETEHPFENEYNEIENAWMVHQMETTSNFARENKFLCWYIGGLNFQIEHHLFPKVCSIHYPKICYIVEEVAKKYDIPYNKHESFFEAVRSHYRTLKKFGDPSYMPGGRAELGLAH